MLLETKCRGWKVPYLGRKGHVVSQVPEFFSLRGSLGH